MKEYLNKVQEFNTIFEVNTSPTSKEDYIKGYELRHSLTIEENEEYLEACDDDNKVEIADALGDELYILCGKILYHGLQDKIQDVFNEIHRSNMSKLDENGDPIFRNDGKVLKGKGYFKPNLKPIIES